MRKRRSTEKEESTGESFEQKNSFLSGAVFTLLFVVMIFSTLAYGAVDPWVLGVNCFLVGLTLIFWLADSIFTKTLKFSTNKLQFPILGLILIGLIQLLPLASSGISSDLLSIPASSALSHNPFGTKLAVVQLSIFLIFFAAMLMSLNSQKRVQRAVFVIIAFSSVMAFFGIIQYLSGSEYIFGIRKVEYAMPFASFINRHHFASLMEMTMGLTLSLIYGGATQRDKKLLLIIAILLMGIAIVLTGSRGGLLSMLAVVAFVTIVSLKYKTVEFEEYDTSRSFMKSYGNYILIGSSAALLLGLLGSVLLLGGDSALIRGTGLSEQSDFSNGRAHFWSTALQIIASNPILGTGLDSFGMPFTKFDTWNGLMRVEQAHNDYLQILSDAGIIGFVCVAAFIYLLYSQGLKLAKQTSDRFGRGVIIGSLAGCFGILMHSLVDFPLRTSANGFFFLTLAALATTVVKYSRSHRR